MKHCQLSLQYFFALSVIIVYHIFSVFLFSFFCTFCYYCLSHFFSFSLFFFHLHHFSCLTSLWRNIRRRKNDRNRMNIWKNRCRWKKDGRDGRACWDSKGDRYLYCFTCGRIVRKAEKEEKEGKTIEIVWIFEKIDVDGKKNREKLKKWEIGRAVV